MVHQKLSANQLKKLLQKDADIHIFDYLDSTNTKAKSLAQNGGEEGEIIIALSQTGGKGRMGRSFYSPKESGLYFSIILRPTIKAEDISLITPTAAVAVTKAIEELTQKAPKIKWVNDIFVNGKKVCGILSEAAFNSNGSAEFVILGIGINLMTPEEGFPDDIKNIAGGLADKDEILNANELVAAVVNNFFELYKNLRAQDTVTEYQKRMLLVGESINYTQNGEEKSGTVEGIDDAFRLIIKNKNGDLTHLQSGEVTIGSKSFT